jgi:chromosomal replication initiation ATPase DnaA
MSQQLTFDLPVREALGRDDFFVSEANRHALAALDLWRTWPMGKLLLIGPAGSGKSHLAAVWAAEAEAELVTLSTDAPPAAQNVVVDGLDLILSGRAAEERLFHLHNHVLERGGRLLLTSRSDPTQLCLSLPDLHSRLSATPQIRIDAPDDALLAAVLLKQFADRQLAVAPAVITWLLPRIPRDLASLATLVAEMDRRALAAKSAVTRKLAAEALEAFEATS